MTTSKPQWVQAGERTWTKTLPHTTLVVSQLPVGDWRAEHFEDRKWGRLQINRVSTKDEAIKECERYARES